MKHTGARLSVGLSFTFGGAFTGLLMANARDYNPGIIIAATTVIIPSAIGGGLFIRILKDEIRSN